MLCRTNESNALLPVTKPNPKEAFHQKEKYIQAKVFLLDNVCINMLILLWQGKCVSLITFTQDLCKQYLFFSMDMNSVW